MGSFDVSVPGVSRDVCGDHPIFQCQYDTSVRIHGKWASSSQEKLKKRGEI